MFQDNLEKHVFFSDWLLNLFVVFFKGQSNVVQWYACVAPCCDFPLKQVDDEGSGLLLQTTFQVPPFGPLHIIQHTRTHQRKPQPPPPKKKVVLSIRGMPFFSRESNLVTGEIS